MKLLDQTKHKPFYESACGRAVILCGDCRDFLPDLRSKIDAIVSDPPYGIKFRHSGGGKGIKASNHTEPIIGDDQPFDPSHLLGWDKVLLFGANHYASRLPEGKGNWIAWDKSVGCSPNDSFRDAEFIWSSAKTARNIIRYLWRGLIRDGEESSNLMRRLHVSQKPVSVMIQCLEILRVRLGSCVCDPYMGSGSTGVACLRTGRRFIGIEIDPKFCGIARERIEKELAR